jgi:HK97 family phage prohead protease
MNYKRLDLKSYIEDVDEKGIVKIRVSAFGNIDSYGDIMDQKAFNKTVSDFSVSGKTRIKHLKNHNWNQAIGVPLEMTSTEKGLDIVSKINIGKQLGAETFSDYKFYAENGQTLEHSIGYSVVKEEPSEELKANILKEVNLMEYSSLDFLGANSETPLLDLKSIDMNAEELLKRIEVLEAKIKSLEPLDNTQAENEAKEKAVQVELLKLKLN